MTTGTLRDNNEGVGFSDGVYPAPESLDVTHATIVCAKPLSNNDWVAQIKAPQALWNLKKKTRSVSLCACANISFVLFLVSMSPAHVNVS